MCQNVDMTIRHAVAGDSGLTLPTWGSSTCTNTWHTGNFATTISATWLLISRHSGFFNILKLHSELRANYLKYTTQQIFWNSIWTDKKKRKRTLHSLIHASKLMYAYSQYGAKCREHSLGEVIFVEVAMPAVRTSCFHRNGSSLPINVSVLSGDVHVYFDSNQQNYAVSQHTVSLFLCLYRSEVHLWNWTRSVGLCDLHHQIVQKLSGRSWEMHYLCLALQLPEHNDVTLFWGLKWFLFTELKGRLYWKCLHLKCSRAFALPERLHHLEAFFLFLFTVPRVA